jgi:NTP pyrophosphatase (non-canonical NTP hydrolase)
MDKLYAVTRGLNRRFPAGNDPFKIMTRLLEESGELAQAVNHFEGTGIKRQKYGEPDRAHLAKEVMDVLRCALQTALYYGIEQELEDCLESAYQRLQAEGWLTADNPQSH